MPDHAPAPAGRRIALIAHDNKKQDMIEWAEYNLDLLAGHELFATATTGHPLQQQLGLPVTCSRSGALRTLTPAGDPTATRPADSVTALPGGTCQRWTSEPEIPYSPSSRVLGSASTGTRMPPVNADPEVPHLSSPERTAALAK
jgi:hypothetical protein